MQTREQQAMLTAPVDDDYTEKHLCQAIERQTRSQFWKIDADIQQTAKIMRPYVLTGAV